MTQHNSLIGSFNHVVQSGYSSLLCKSVVQALSWLKWVEGDGSGSSC